MMHYTKLFSSLVHSTVWREPDHVRLVWITMLALADQHGFVDASVPGLADVSRVSVDECREALEKLKAPDPDSRSQEYEGRRIEDSEGGWCLLNYGKYREMLSQADKARANRERVARWRAKQRSNGTGVTVPECSSGVPDGNGCHDKQKQKEKEKQKQTENTEQTGRSEAPAAPPKKKSPRKKPLAPMPPNWTPDKTRRGQASRLGLDVEAEANNFRDWTGAKGMLYANWDLGFGVHLRSQAKRAGSHEAAPPPQKEWTSPSRLPPEVT